MAKMSAFISSDWGWPDDQLSEFASPVLVIIGDNDFIQPSHALHLHEVLPDAQLAILPATTHRSILSWPGLADMIVNFHQTTGR